MGDVLAVEHVLEVNGGDTLIALADSLFKAGSGRGGRNDTATGGLQLAVDKVGAGVENEGPFGGRVKSDLLALGVRARVATSDGNDRGGEVGLDLDGNTVKPVFRAGNHDLGQIGIIAEQGQQGLGLGVPTTNIVLEDLGAVLGHHQTGKENADEREAWKTY